MTSLILILWSVVCRENIILLPKPKFLVYHSYKTSENKIKKTYIEIVQPHLLNNRNNSASSFCKFRQHTLSLGG